METSISTMSRIRRTTYAGCVPLIIGPAGTPYGFGQFEFKMSFPVDYPTNPPQVHIVTTDGGRTRFNPNLYANGKVCIIFCL